jgi:alkyldihydroxyacetonephosphate synthase
MIDERSLMFDVEGARTLADVEAELAPRGLTLGFSIDAAVGSLSVADWIARGMPGAGSVFSDPADHPICGLVGTVGDRTVHIRPVPRRAVGPDLVALFVGTHQRLGRVTSAVLRIHRKGVRRPSLPLPACDLDPPMSAAEERMVDAIARELCPASERVSGR